MTIHSDLLQVKQLNSMEISIYFIFKTIKCDRSTWPARWKVDRSTPKSVRTLSVDRPLFRALVPCYTRWLRRVKNPNWQEGWPEGYLHQYEGGQRTWTQNVWVTSQHFKPLGHAAFPLFCTRKLFSSNTCTEIEKELTPELGAFGSRLIKKPFLTWSW